jgi:hypothetical protein
MEHDTESGSMTSALTWAGAAIAIAAVAAYLAM